MDSVKQSECERCKSLEAMVRALSAIIDMEDLPRGISIENYKRLLNGTAIRLRRPKPIRRKKT